MYLRYYGLEALPFELTPNPRYLLLTPTHREALSMLEYGVNARKGVILLIGDAGTGKTTLLRKALSLQLAASGATGADCVYISNPRLTPGEFFEEIALGFGLDRAALTSKPQFLRHLRDALTARHVAGKSVALIVDEAQCLSDGLLEELRLLANIEDDDAKLLPLVLAGQPELSARLDQHELRQFKQRIALRCDLAALDLQETATYIFGRVRLAGGDAAQLFNREAVHAVFEGSRGIPRTISVICDNALLAGFALERRPIDAGIIREVCGDLSIGRPEPELPAAADEQPAPPTQSEVALDVEASRRQALTSLSRFRNAR